MEQSQRGRARFSLVAVNEQRMGGGVFGSEGEEVTEGFELKEGHGRIDDVEVEVKGPAEGEVVWMVGLEAAGITDGSLVAGRLAGVDDGEVRGAGAAGGFVAEEEHRVDFVHGGLAPVYSLRRPMAILRAYRYSGRPGRADVGAAEASLARGRWVRLC